ncbi:UDP-N-acetylglucosamine 2-epimerase (non-hydrolyzing) [Sphingomonas sp.]|uniref:non-hydrolyzing UDP-N-acetylglucosamine 2-epimerase n=1 Tax=Sphingomonas sp. TaxID=28214 RepID=UPI0025F5C0A2|nr:UDP-N-acetylglucosamine 2-epimerase (non-hydrolyzing) [Sphingomonas sp.]MBV9527829.1 UDP-N-acetylglucosamine 2-epimerase (non-hydrolyzing) [Sphingomonas sp.]
MIGTRPEAIKLAPVAHALAARGLASRIVVTGQHPSLDLRQFGFGAYPRVDLNCAGQANPHAHVRKVAAAMGPVLRAGTDFVVVQGDTSSALGGTLASVRASVPFAHVEAGLRTGDRLRPWPEESYRIRIDRDADLLFAVSDLSAGNLKREAVGGEVHVTGNTGVDALLPVAASLGPARVRERARPRLLVTCHRRESWREGLHSIASALRELVSDAGIEVQFVLHPNPHVQAIMRGLLADHDAIALIDPCIHRELMRRMNEADIVLSDSGGMQEEAPSLGVPLLVLREITERPEGIATGNMRLVGTCPERIVAEVKRLLGDPAAYAAMSRRAYPYGDGRAAPRIATIIDDWLAARRQRLARAASW